MSVVAHYGDIQFDIYAAGTEGHRPEWPVDHAGMHDMARRTLAPTAYGRGQR